MSKTVITLSALYDLCLDRFDVHRVLVIAPLRVARDTWPAEIQKWDHLKGLTWSVAVGTAQERLAALRQKTFLHIINRENVQWLIEDSGIRWEYDMIVIDELSSFKSHQAKRFRSLLKVRPGVKRIVGLTGTPSSNGLMDLWAEFRLLDMGKRLGRFITHYRDQFFMPDARNMNQIFSYKPRPGAEAEIYRRIRDMTISMKSTDYRAVLHREAEFHLRDFGVLLRRFRLCHGCLRVRQPAPFNQHRPERFQQRIVIAYDASVALNRQAADPVGAGRCT